MADKFIDLDETQIYGPYSARMIRGRLEGLVPEFDPALKYVANEIEHATSEIKQLIEDSRHASANVRQVSQTKGPILRQATTLLGRFSKHLDTHNRGEIDRRTYFPEDGTATGVGKSAPRVLLALGRISTMLQKTDCPVRDHERWQNEISEVIQALKPIIEHSQNAKTERLGVTPELENSRQAWLHVYAAAKFTVEAVLRLTGKLHLMSTIFYDLAVPGTVKVTEIPPEPPVEAKEDAFTATVN